MCFARYSEQVKLLLMLNVRTGLTVHVLSPGIMDRNVIKESDPGGHAFFEVRLLPLDSWNRGFESLSEHECSSRVLNR
jgi:hypothetical protein